MIRICRALPLAVALFASAIGSGLCIAAETPAENGAIEFNRDIRPILWSRCIKCHGRGKQEGGLRLDLRELAVAKADSGEVAVIPGKPIASELIRRVMSDDDDLRMPAEGDPLTPAEIAKLNAWIAQGAKWQKHWSFVKPKRAKPPAVKNANWPRNSMDHFILARLEKAGLSPSSEASREKLIRRLSLDLTGLPPSVEEVDAFVADSRFGAYERLTDRLLASPAFGERWARHWLDAARYGDSNGYQRDNRRDVWAYRDWVVRAFNDDMPFDQFTIEQIAGDLLPGSTLQQKIATGFNRGTLVNVEAGTDPEEERTIAVIDRVNTTAAVWLGLSLGCAQCHEHKYDPFTQQDYYQFYAFFNSTAAEIRTAGSRRDFIGPKVELLLTPRQRERRNALQAAVKRLNQRKQIAISTSLKDMPRWEREMSAKKTKLPANLDAILSMDSAKRNGKQKKLLEERFLSTVKAVKKVKQLVVAMEKKLKAAGPATSLTMRELEKPRPTHILIRGDFLKLGEPVEAGTPSVLHAISAKSPGQRFNRLDLARWLVDAENPLAARVTVNRFWAEIFGRGLVATPEEFGAQGDPPTHPSLLDWLASEFADGWSIKSIIRRIVTSSTYRQDSRVSSELLAVDPENMLYARGPRFRMSAEMVRDNALAISGLLSAKMSGPPVFPFQPSGVWNHIGVTSNKWIQSRGEDQYRRGLYVYWRRTVPFPSFVNFDAPSRESCVVQRSRSNTPLQALTLMNDPVFFEAAGAFAGRIMQRKSAASPSDRALHAFRVALARRPRPNEFRVLIDCYQQELAYYRKNRSAARKLAAKWSKVKDVDAAEFAAWLQVATVLLNLDETITKG